jgi:hypothetical protein
MTAINPLPLILAIALILPTALCSNFTKVQVDLVFPRNNTAYKPDSRFPIIFALHGWESAWHYRPSLLWQLTEATRAQIRDAPRGAFQFPNTITQRIGWDWDGKWDDSNPVPVRDEYLVINDTSSSQNVWSMDHRPEVKQSTKFTLEWVMDMAPTCGNKESLYGPERNLTCFDERTHNKDICTDWSVPQWGFRGFIEFEINNITGIALDYTADRCAEPLGAVEVQGWNQTWKDIIDKPSNRHAKDNLCPIWTKPRPKPEECKFRGSAGLKNEVDAAYFEILKCNVPDRAAYNDECTQKKINMKSMGATLTAGSGVFAKALMSFSVVGLFLWFFGEN